MAGILAASAIISGVTGLASLGSGIAGKISANRKARIEDAKAARAQRRLEALERGRQRVLDQSDQIRGLKDQVFNPMQNLGVAMQGINMQREAVDESLANTLNSLNQAGVGAGAATQLARAAATSKAQVAAGIEKQELTNQGLRLEGEATKQKQLMGLEQMAIKEEANAWGRQEDRDLAQLDRLANLQANAEQSSLAYLTGGQELLSSGVAGFGQAVAQTADIYGTAHDADVGWAN